MPPITDAQTDELKARRLRREARTAPTPIVVLAVIFIDGGSAACPAWF